MLVKTVRVRILNRDSSNIVYLHIRKIRTSSQSGVCSDFLFISKTLHIDATAVSVKTNSGLL